MFEPVQIVIVGLMTLLAAMAAVEISRRWKRREQLYFLTHTLRAALVHTAHSAARRPRRGTQLRVRQPLLLK